MSESLASSLYLTDPAAAQRLRRAKMAEQLIAQGSEATPIRAHSQGIARMAQALMGGIMLGNTEREAQDAQSKMEGEAADWAGRVQGAASSASPAAAMAASSPKPPPPPPQAGPSPAMALAGPAPQLAGNTPRALNMNAGRQRDAILADNSLSPEQQQAALARVSEARLVAGGTPPRPGAYGGARGTWDDGLPPPTGAVNPNVAGGRYNSPAPWQGQQAPPQPPTAPPATGVDLAELVKGLSSRNPLIKAQAEALYKAETLRRREEAPGPIVQTVGPQGEGQYERTAQGLKYVGPIVREPREPPQVQTQEMVVNGVSGVYTVGRDGKPIERIGEPYQAPQQPPQPSEQERLANQWRTLEKKRATVGLSQDEQLAFDDLSRMRQRPEQVAAGPTGIAVMGPAPLPQYGGGTPTGGGLTMPMNSPAPGPAQRGLVTQTPMPQQAVPGQDASAMPPVGARGAQTMTTPGGRPITVQPAPSAPPPGYQRGADQSTLEPVPGGPADPKTRNLNDTEGKANLFGQAMLNGDRILAGLKVPNTVTMLAWRNAPESLVNMGLGENDQKYFNAVRQFAAGILRKETGAAFAPVELLDVQSRFFPMPGDSAASIAQKTEARRQAIESLRAEVPGGFRGGEPPAARLRFNPATGRIE